MTTLTISMLEKLSNNPLVVQLGVGDCENSLLLLKRRKDLYLITIDCQENLRKEKEALQDANLWNGRNEQICSTPKDEAKVWGNLYSDIKIDLIIGCKKDIFHWLSYFRQRVII